MTDWTVKIVSPSVTVEAPVTAKVALPGPKGPKGETGDVTSEAIAARDAAEAAAAAAAAAANDAIQGLANDVAALIAGLAGAATPSTLGVNDTASNAMRFAVMSDFARFTAETADFEMFLRRKTATDNARLAWGENLTKRFTLGIEGDNDLALTASPDGILIYKALAIYGATGHANFLGRIGIGVGDSPLFGIQLKGGAFGGTLPAANSGSIVQENSGTINDHFLTPDTNPVNFFFGSPSRTDYGWFQAFWNAGTPYLRFLVNGTESIRLSAAGINAPAGDYFRAGVKVVGARDTGWVAMTGVSDKSTPVNTETATVLQLARRLRALEAMALNHGLAGT